MNKDELFASLNDIKKPALVSMYMSLYNSREELLIQHKTVLKNWGPHLEELRQAVKDKDQRIAELEEENSKLNNYNEELRKNYEKCIEYWKLKNIWRNENENI